MMFALFAPTGEIRSILTGDAATAAKQGLDWLPCGPNVLDTTHYVDAGVIVEKQHIPFTQSQDDAVITLAGLPSGIEVTCLDSVAISDGTDLEIEFDAPGNYTIKLEGGVPYLAETIEVSIL